MVFILASAVIFYVLFGYPLLLKWMADRQEKPVLKDDRVRSVSVVICVRNGEKFIGRRLQMTLAQNYPRELIEILVVSDGSEDRTEEIVRSFQDQGVKLLRVPHGGKAAALNAAIPLVSGEILILSDIRQILGPDCFRNLIGCFGDPMVGVVSSTVRLRHSEQHDEYDSGLYRNYEGYMRWHMSRVDSTFGTHGPLYALRRSLWVPLPSDTILDDVYLPLTAFFKGYRVVIEPTALIFEVPVALHGEFKRKVRLQAGLYQLLKLMPEMLSSKNRMRAHFLSAKYGRMLVPYCLIAIALATLGLPGVWRSLFGTAQVLFYGAAAVDLIIPPSFPLKRLTAPIRAFVVLMAGSVAALKIFFVPPQRLWKDAGWRVTPSAPPQSRK